MKHVWVIKVTFNNKTVNLNEAYTSYDKAKYAILRKIDECDRKYLSDYRFYDIQNEIEYELKLVDIID